VDHERTVERPVTIVSVLAAPAAGIGGGRLAGTRTGVGNGSDATGPSPAREVPRTMIRGQNRGNDAPRLEGRCLCRVFRHSRPNDTGPAREPAGGGSAAIWLAAHTSSWSHRDVASVAHRPRSCPCLNRTLSGLSLPPGNGPAEMFKPESLIRSQTVQHPGKHGTLPELFGSVRQLLSNDHDNAGPRPSPWRDTARLGR
jgi:hypothetical protein